MKSLYDILEVDKNASIDEIKRSYKKLSMNHHPDRNQGSKESEEKFKEISSAYAILSDPEKKQKYDTFGTTDDRGQSFDMNDIFSQFGDIFGGFGFKTNRRKRGNDLRIKSTLSLVEIMFGVDKKIKYKRQCKCDSCSGSGGTDIQTCSSCKGSGQKVYVQQTPFGRIQQVAVCDSCSGDGKTVKNKCHKCYGDGVITKDETVDIKIPAGIVGGNQLTMQGYGNEVKGGDPGDLYIFIEETQDDKFVRDGINLITNEWISISDAVLGTKISIDSLSGEIELDVPSGCESGKKFFIKGKGIPSLSSNGNIYGHGDLIIVVNVKIPKLITTEQKEFFIKLKEIL